MFPPIAIAKAPLLEPEAEEFGRRGTLVGGLRPSRHSSHQSKHVAGDRDFIDQIPNFYKNVSIFHWYKPYSIRKEEQKLFIEDSELDMSFGKKNVPYQ